MHLRAVTSRMKTTFALLAATLLLASSAFAGVTYDYSSVSTGVSNTTINGSVKAEGPNIRIDVGKGDGVLFDTGSYVVSTNGGKTMNVVNPSQKSFYTLNLEELVGSANSLLKNIGGGMLKLDVRNPKVSVTGGAASGKLQGFDTKKSNVATTYEIAVEGLGRPMSMNMTLNTEVWWTDQLSAEFTNFLQMQGMRTGLEAIDKLIEAERGAIKGFPLKQVTTTRVSFAGKDMTSTTTSTVSNVKRAQIPANQFAMPKGYTQKPNPLESMMTRLAPR